jgi:hypothetical protein
VRYLSGHEGIAATVSRNAQKEGLEFFLNAQTHRIVLGLIAGFNLKPLAVFALSPFRAGHRFPPLFCQFWLVEDHALKRCREFPDRHGYLLLRTLAKTSSYAG